MSHNVPAGWYPDQTDNTLLRYWDGVQWTEHTHPAQAGAGQEAQAGAGQEAQAEAGGYGHAEAQGQQHYDQPAQYDQTAQYGQASAGGYGQAPGYGQASAGGYGQTSAGGYGQAPGYGQPGHSPGPGDQQKRKTGVLIAIIAVGAAILAGLVLLGIWVFSGDDEEPGPDTTTAQPTEDPTADPTEDPTDDPADDPTDEPTADPGGQQQDGGNFVVGDVMEGSIEVGGTWAATMTIEESGVTIIDAIRGEGEPDLTLTLLDGSGAEIAYNDDRGGQVTGLIGGHTFDPYLAPWLEAGDYTVVVGSWSDSSEGGFELYTTQVNESAIGTEETVELGEFEYVGRALIVPEAGEYTITASAEEWEAAIALFDSDGTSYTLEDPHSGEATLTADLEPGGYLFIIADPGGDPDTFTFVVEDGS